ncbi:tetratricopeptide repeat protein [candidate division KSB1 bacterium]|nr:tetratricopeptide repeat protein [candidate division KSB1 bacterium]
MENVVLESSITYCFAPDNIVNGRYKIVKELGKGGMGIVFLVEDTARDNEIVVLKVFQSENPDRELMEILRKEFSILAAMRHPNLVCVYDFGKISGKNEYFFTMEFVKGVEFLKAVKGLSLKEKLHLFSLLVQALDYIHVSGIFHGDIKSENILVFQDMNGQYNLKLMDFGLAVREQEKINSNCGGTLEYLAPELFQNNSLNVRTDLYAVGVLMYWALTGQAPFCGKPDDIKNGHLKKVSARVTSLNPEIPNHIANVVTRLLAKEPLERYSSSEELLTAIGVGKYDLTLTDNLITPLIWDSFLKIQAGDINNLFDIIYDIINDGQTHNKTNFLSIMGNEGSGHNRIIDELKYRLQINDIQVLEGWCRDDKSSTYQSLIDIFKGYSEIEDLIDDAIQKLFSTRSGKDDYELQRLKFMDELCDKIKSLCHSNPLVIILRDIELANEGIIDLVYYLGRALSHENCAILVSTTNEKLTQDVAVLLQKGKDSLQFIHEHGIKSLDKNQIDQLLQTAFSVNLFPQNFTNDLYEKSGGSPVIIAAIMTALNKSGYFNRSDKTWLLSDNYDLKSLELKDVNNLYSETFFNLSNSQQAILRIAAVYDFSIEKKFFTKLLNFSDEKFEYEISFLLEKRILLTNITFEHFYYHFLSNVFKDTVYNIIPEEERRLIHIKIINLYKQQKVIELTVEQQAYHYLKAGYIEKGLPLASIALTKLKNSYSNRRALFIADLAFSNCGSNEKRFQRLFKRHIAEIQETLGDADKALENFNSLLNDYKPGIVKSALLRRISSLHQKLGNLDDAVKCLNEALSVVPDRAVIERALIFRELSWISLIQGQYQDSIALGKKTLNILPDDTPSRTLALTLNNLGGASFYAGDINQAVNYFSQSAKVKKVLGDQRSMAATLNNLGIVHNVSGNHEKAKEYWLKSLEIMEQIGDMAGLAETFNNLGILLMESGQYEKALIYYKKCKDLKNRIGDIKGLVASHCNIGELLFLREDYSQALETLDEGIKFAERIKIYSDKAEMLYQKARVYLALNQLEAANYAVDGCLSLSESINDKTKLCEYFIFKAKTYYILENQFDNIYLKKAEELNAKEKNQNLGMLLNLEYLNYYVENREIEKALDKFQNLKKLVESSNYRWYQVQLLILFSKTLILDNRPMHIIEKTLNKAEDIAKSMGLMLQIKTIYLLRGLLKQKSGDLITSYKCYRKAYQCLKLCLTHITQDEYKQSLIMLSENKELLKKIKDIKTIIKTS